MAYFDERRRSNALIARTSALEETYEALIGNDGSLEGLSQNLLTSSNDLKARQDIICEQVCTITKQLLEYTLEIASLPLLIPARPTFFTYV